LIPGLIFLVALPIDGCRNRIGLNERFHLRKLLLLLLLEHLFYFALSDFHVASWFGEVELLDFDWLEDWFFLFLLVGSMHFFHDFVHLIETLHPFDSSFLSFLFLPLILRSG
jgi:hypothetical protein